MQTILTIPSAGWNGPYPVSVHKQVIEHSSRARLFLPDLPFAL